MTRRSTFHWRGILVLAVVSALGLAHHARAQTTLYVDDDAPPGGTGLTWSTAHRFLQDALADAMVVGGTVEIHVAQGVYTPDRDAASPGGTGDREATFQLINDIAIGGGYRGAFDGTGLPPEDRGIALFETILSGDLNGDDASGGDNSENSYHVVTGSGTDASALLEGFTIHGGNAEGPAAPENSGGGMLNIAGSPTVSNCTFTANRAVYGGGVENFEDSNPTVTNCTFSGNRATSNGGGMYNWSSSPMVTNCMFGGNWARGDLDVVGGGGMSNHNGSSPTVANCTFVDNGAHNTHDWWGLARGGAMLNSDSSPTVIDCVFSSNAAISRVCDLMGYCSPSGSGGGMGNADSSAMVSSCTFEGNTAAAGAGMYNIGDSSPTVTDCTFRQNTGGGMTNDGTDATVINCVFYGNIAGECGLFSLFSGAGGGMCNNSANPTVADCSFSGNVALLGGGMANILGGPTVANCTFSGNDGGGGMFNYDGTNVEVSNCILWGNANGQIFGSATTTVLYSIVQDGWAGTGNVDADPTFVRNPDPGPDGEWATHDDDYGILRLLPGSPAVDAADNTAVPLEITTDLDGNPRFVDDPDTLDTGYGDPPIVDMGAYEFQLPCPWDLNGDGEVNVLDLIELVMSFGPCEECPADFDDDGFVNVVDLIALIMNFGPCPGSECVWDVTGDGVVDQTDVEAVTSNLGPCDDPDNCPWDVNGDGVVDGSDVQAVATHFGPCP
ncbi:MAG: right-handed parallel beta-helix repeat-containing protein [Planctomycetota bacterium]|jgi:hypothetical protein